MIDNSLATVTADMIAIVIVIVAVIIIFLFIIWFYDKNIIIDIINFLFPIIMTICDQMIIHYLTQSTISETPSISAFISLQAYMGAAVILSAIFESLFGIARLGEE